MKILKQIKIKILLLVTITCFFVISCVPVQQTTNKTGAYRYNFSSIYKPGESLINPKCRVFINSDTSAIVYYKISKKEINAISNSQNQEQTKLLIKYIIRNAEDFSIIDSSSMVNVIKYNEFDEHIQSYFSVKIEPKKSYKLIVSFVGERENSGKRIILDIDNSKEWAFQSFLPEIFNEQNSIIFDNFVNAESQYIISSSKKLSNQITIEYYTQPDYLVVPPYYMTNNISELKKPDSLFIYQLGDTIKFDKIGFYVFKPSTQEQGAFGLISKNPSFPDIAVVNDMVEPLKLIATNKEYNEITTGENTKLAIDNFWLSKSNNQKFAKEQIRVFYNRVKLANEFFTENIDGWKTDRGMLYVLMGPPTIVNMSSVGEEWFYGENPDLAGVLFVFDKNNNPYYGNTYVLRRESAYQTIWAQAITTWKNGRIFTITKN